MFSLSVPTSSAWSAAFGQSSRQTPLACHSRQRSRPSAAKGQRIGASRFNSLRRLFPIWTFFSFCARVELSLNRESRWVLLTTAPRPPAVLRSLLEFPSPPLLFCLVRRWLEGATKLASSTMLLYSGMKLRIRSSQMKVSTLLTRSGTSRVVFACISNHFQMWKLKKCTIRIGSTQRP